MDKNPISKVDNSIEEALRRIPAIDVDNLDFESVGIFQKGKLVRVELCSLPTEIREYEGVPYFEPISISKTDFVTESDGILIFIPTGGEKRG